MITNLTIGRYGRFGNALFQIAAVIGIGQKCHIPYGFLPFVNHDHKERFGSTEDVELDKYFINPLPGLGKYTAQNFAELPVEWGYHDIYPRGGINWNITGHFQSEKYFKHCLDEVRHYLDMKRIPQDDAFADSVAVHIRRGDYDDRYHTRLSAPYYLKAMAEFPKGTPFVIYSDDPNIFKEDWVCLAIEKYNVIAKSRMPDYISDWARMKRSAGFICGNSSYSLMAAILSDAPNKKVVCPSNWFGPAWNPSTVDLYPEGAIVI